MENSIQRIKKEIELKRKHNQEILKQLKEKSIIYNANKEKKKHYFLNNISSTFLNKKRKIPNHNDNVNDIIENNEIYEDLSNYNDYDDYLGDFMNNSFISNRSFNNLNFCRPEKFSLIRPKIKLTRKKEETFTIYKAITKPKETSKISDISNTLSNSGNINENTKNNSNIINTSFGFRSNEDTNKDVNINQSLFGIKDNKIEIKKQDQLFGFKPNADTNKNPDSNQSLFDIKEKNTETKKEKIGLFGFISSEKKDENTKSLFSSNITEENKKEEKNKIINTNTNTNEDKKDNNKSVSLFGDLSRLNNVNEEGKSLFGPPKESKPEPEKPNITEKKDISKTIDNDDKIVKPETPKKTTISLFGSDINNSKAETKIEKEEKKEVISISNIIGLKKENDENKIENKKEDKPIIENKDNNNKSLFGTGLLFNSEEKKEDIKEEKKEKLNLFGIKEIKEKEEKKENEKKSLFGDLIKKEDIKKPADNSFTLFNTDNTGSNNLFGQKNENTNDKKENNQPVSFGLFSTEKKDNNISNTSLFGFKADEEKNKNNGTSLFGVKEEEKNKNNGTSLFGVKEEDKNKNNENQSVVNVVEEKKINLVNTQGSLASDSSNPFLNPSKQNNLPIIFSANSLTNTNNFSNINNSNSTNQNSSIFSGNMTNNNIFNNNNYKNVFLFQASTTNSGGMDMSPQMKPRNILGNMSNNNSSTNNNLFSIGSKSTNNLNIFGAPMDSNNSNSLFGNKNSFGNSSGNIFSSQQSNMFSGGNLPFSLGVKFSLGKK